MYPLFKKKGACIPSYPAEKQKNAPKSRRGCWFKITTLKWKNINFSTGVPPWQHMTPWMRANTGNIRYFEKWGDFEEKVERQGKGDQNVWRTHWCSSKPLGSQHGLLRRNSSFKSQIFLKWPLFHVIFTRRILLTKMRQNECNFWKYWVLKTEFLLNKPCCEPKGLEEHQWVHSRHFGHLSPGVLTFPENPSIFQDNG